MTREEAKKEIYKAFEPAFANYIITALEEGATVSDRCEDAKMEKHTDRQIYDGCIYLMQMMVDYFQEYLDYLGYDLDKLDEDERFAVEVSNMEIVRWLFLINTGNSGGCSTIDFCEKLGVDPYKSVKFEFDWYEEE